MRILAFVIVAAAALWGGYWYWGSSALESRAESWLEARRAEGWQADGRVNVRGFPNRFDMTLSDPVLADPDTGLAWSAPFFQVLALSYKPNHVIAVWPDTQTLQTPIERLTITSDKMRGSVIFDADSDLGLDRSVIEIDGMAVSAGRGWQADLARAQVSARRLQDEAPLDASVVTYELDFDADTLRLPPEAVAALDPSRRLPEQISTLKLNGAVGFDRPWDRRAVEDRRPQPRHIRLDEVRANWGSLDLRATGEVSVDDQGIPEGRVTVKAQNWREILSLAVNAGTVPQQFAPTIENVLGMLASGTGETDTLDVPITFTGGRMMFGPIPLGMAPRLVLR